MSKDRDTQVEIIVFKIIEGKPLFLLLKRVPERGDFWQPITGGVEAGEEIESAAKRELLEETGIDEWEAFYKEVYYFEFNSEGYGHRKEYVFGVQVKQGAEVTLSWEHNEMKWCPLEEALDLLRYETNKASFRKMNEKLESSKAQ